MYYVITKGGVGEGVSQMLTIAYVGGGEANPLLISTGFLKYPVSLDNFSISKFSV